MFEQADDKALEQESGEQERKPVETKTFAEQVNELVGQMVQKEDGTWELPEGEFDEATKYAVVSEKRRRDAQSALGKEQHARRTIELEAEALRKRIASQVRIDMTPEEKEELDELKFSDPEAWRNKMNELESAATQKVQSELDEVSGEVTQQSELERRQKVLDDYNKQNPDFALSQDVVDNDIPPRITKKLETGEISFEEFLDECKTFLSTGKVVKQEKVTKTPNLGEIGGDVKLPDSVVERDIIDSYNHEVF